MQNAHTDCIVSNRLQKKVFRIHFLTKLIWHVCLVDEADDPPSENKENESVDVDAFEAAANVSNPDFVTGSCFDDKCIQVNYPVVIKQFVCPETEHDKVLMVVDLPGGAKDPKIELQQDGFWVYVKYKWPSTMYDVQDTFKAQFDANEFQSYHPMVLAFKEGLREVRKRVNMCPDGVMKVFLPIKVQTAPKSYETWAIRRDNGAQIAFGIFTGFVKEYDNKTSDETLKFL